MILTRGVRAGTLGFAAFASLSATLVTYLVTRGEVSRALIVALLPLAAWLFIRPTIVLVALGASLPALMSIAGQSGGFHVAASDLLLVAAAALILADAAVTGSFPALTALRPVAPVVLPYTILMIALLPFHPGVGEVAQTLQRYELFLIPLVVGAFVAIRGAQERVLQAYVLASTVLALAWPFVHFGMQKNPVGQLFANAILLLAALPALRGLYPCLLALIPALLYTESRGAIASTLIGLAVIVAFQQFSARALVTRVLPVVLVIAGAFALMPASLRARVTTIHAGVNTPAAYSLQIRQGFSSDAHRIIHQHPWTGVGVGNYLAADRASPNPSDDPHEVILLEAAEGGYGFAGGFLLLVVGTAVVMLKRMPGTAIATAAVAVLIATAAHGLVDVYWVRGTPVLGWLLVGIACGELMKTGHRLEHSG